MIIDNQSIYINQIYHYYSLLQINFQLYINDPGLYIIVLSYIERISNIIKGNKNRMSLK